MGLLYKKPRLVLTDPPQIPACSESPPNPSAPGRRRCASALASGTPSGSRGRSSAAPRTSPRRSRQSRPAGHVRTIRQWGRSQKPGKTSKTTFASLFPDFAKKMASLCPKPSPNRPKSSPQGRGPKPALRSPPLAALQKPSFSCEAFAFGSSRTLTRRGSVGRRGIRRSRSQVVEIQGLQVEIQGRVAKDLSVVPTKFWRFRVAWRDWQGSGDCFFFFFRGTGVLDQLGAYHPGKSHTW